MIVHAQHVSPFLDAVDETGETKLIRGDRMKRTETECRISIILEGLYACADWDLKFEGFGYNFS